MLDEGVIDLPREIYAEAFDLDVTAIHLHFSGGNDEGNLNVDVDTKEKNFLTAYQAEYKAQADNADKAEKKRQLALFACITKIEEWATEAYEYNGAGDGNDYGDDITYDLARNKIDSTEWCKQRQEDDPIETPLKIAKKTKESSDT